MILDEFAALSGARLLYVPAMCSTLWSLHGVFVRHWRPGELFFWFWCELMLSGVSGILLTYRWERSSPQGSPARALKEAFNVLMVVVIIGFFATLFSILAWSGDFESLKTLPPYVKLHEVSLILLACGFVVAHLVTAHRRSFPLASKNDVTRPLTSKMWPVLGLYLVMIEQYHLTGSTKLDINRTYLLMMAGALLGFKLIVEALHLFRAPKQPQPQIANEVNALPEREVL